MNISAHSHSHPCHPCKHLWLSTWSDIIAYNLQFWMRLPQPGRTSALSPRTKRTDPPSSSLLFLSLNRDYSVTYDGELCNICRLCRCVIEHFLHNRYRGIFKMTYYTQEEACTRQTKQDPGQNFGEHQNRWGGIAINSNYQKFTVRKENQTCVLHDHCIKMSL